MRTPAALSATLGWLLLAQVASAQTPASAAPSPGKATVPSPAVSAPAPAPAPSAPAPAASAPASATVAPVSTSRTLANPALVVVPAEPDQPPLEPIPSARDTLGGHFVLGAGVGPKWAFGSHAAALATGLGVNLDLGVGLGRNLVLGAWGEYDAYSIVAGCGVCSAHSIAGGPFIRYHLVQGTRFDPWGSLAVGVRSTSIDIRNSNNNYFGFDILKLTLGGDWYPTSNVGFGPYVSFEVGNYSDNGRTGLGTGLRLVLDLPGK